MATRTKPAELAAAQTHELFVLDRQIATLMEQFVDDADMRRQLIRDRRAVRDEINRRVPTAESYTSREAPITD